ncbi:MAG: bifunctional diguanylate cyclase/phosphodiesterase [Ruminococcus sp.]|nr:bifunctional diguanylate cyclase/phosphodiesterase [Ruminococcus sp.]
MGKQRSKKVTATIIVICCVMYLLMQVCMIIFTSRKEPVMVGGLTVPSQTLCGVFSILQVVINIILVLLAGRAGFKTARAVLVVNFLWMILVVVIKKLGGALPGLFIVIVNFFIVILLHMALEKLRSNEEALDKMAHSDSLTSLPNRRAFNQALKGYIERGDKFAIAFIDIDNFKNINDTMGHDYGNQVLIEISRRWNSILGEKHFLARLGGDEFALIISGYKESSDVKALVERYQYTLKEKFLINGKDFYITASIGVSFFPDNSTDSSILLRYADTAMYNAKSEGKHQICLFNQKQMEMMNADVEGENFVKNAVNSQRFQVVYQPLYYANSNKLSGYETLIRFKGENDELIRPYEYIRIAEKLNYISYIDKWVMENSMKKMKPAVDLNPDIKVSVNVSVAFLLSSDFLRTVKRALAETGFPAKNLVVEVTENLFISSVEVAKEVLSALKAMGVNIALDDFGTGYASLSYLHKLPIDVLKIDKSFIDTLDEENGNDEFVQAIISMGHLLGCRIVAEGVETQKQLVKLKQYECDVIQGFLLAKPMSFDDAFEICKNQ